jgi:cbb3-type cytochrome oxidase subunit 1
LYTLVRRFIKTGIGFLAAGIAVGLWMMVQRELLAEWPAAHLRSAHLHALLFGFVLYLILGVALWLFPRAAREDTRYRPEWIAAAYWVLTISTGGRFVLEVGRTWFDPGWLPLAVVVAGFGQAAGLGIYFWTMWTRIRPVGSHLREAKGERF